MEKVKEIYAFLDEMAPFSMQMSFDNAGFLVGRGDRPVSTVLVALDITEEVVAEAVELGAEVIVSHHPILFHPARSITDGDPVGRTVLALIEGGIAAICAHTNLDAVSGGVNDALAQAAGLSQVEMFVSQGVDGQGRPYGIGRIGVLKSDKEISLPEYAVQVKAALGANGVRYVDAGRPVRRVAVGGGACGDYVKDATALGCDTFLTSDVKYNEFLDAKALGLNLIDAGHYPTENIICPVVAEGLREAFPAVKVLLSTRHKEVFSYL